MKTLFFWAISTSPQKSPNLKSFMCSFDLENLIDLPTCYKSINFTCIDLILTNKKNHFMNSTTFEIGSSDYHKLITTILRKTVSKRSSKKRFYRDYKRFDQKKLKLSWNLIKFPNKLLSTLFYFILLSQQCS